MNKKSQTKVLSIIFLVLIVVLMIFALVGIFSLIRNSGKEEVNKVVIPQSIVTHLNDLYQSSTTEFVLWLSGYVENNVATITSYKTPEEVIASENDINFIRCEDQFFGLLTQEKHLGTIHNHQIGICHPSYLDSYTFGRLNDDIMGIICGVDDINFFTPKNLIKSVELEVG